MDGHAGLDRERLVRTFSRLAAVDSPSRQEGRLGRLLIEEMTSLGLQAVDDGTGPDCGNVIASLAGDDGLEPLLFTSHMDVVMPCLGVRPQVLNEVVTSAGDTVLGADAKASIAALLELAHVLTDSRAPRPRPTVELVFTWGEEVGHLGAKALDLDRLRARRGWVLDGLVRVGTIIVAAPTYLSVSIRVAGRAAHAGVEPELGVSAISVVADAISRCRWGRLDPSTTANIGTIYGGSARNAVPAEVHLEGEVRSLDASRAEEVAGGIRATFEEVARDAGARTEIVIQPEYAGYTLGADEAAVVEARRAFEALEGGETSELVRSGGGSDANELNARGVRACVLGIGAENCHSVAERISVSQLELLTRWLLQIVQDAGGLPYSER
jgi:tripeptide aminopeptidase